MRFTLIALGAMAAAMPASAIAADQPRITASIAPVHSLVAGVAGDTGAVHLLVTGSGSPHHHALRPSDAAALQDAGAVFWIGANLEAFLVDAVASLAGDAMSVELGEAPGLARLPLREGGAWAAHGHEDDHDHDDDAAEGHDEAGHDEDAHDHAAFDPHVWLDPGNAAAMVAEIARVLSRVDPENAAAYAENAGTLQSRLDELEGELAAELAPVAATPYIVFHDGYQYFEHRFALAAAGSVSVDPEHRPSAERIAEIRDTIAGRGAACVFAEPQFDGRMIEVLTEDTGARAGVLDPLGAAFEPGPELYFEMMRALAASLKDCLLARN